MKKKDISLLICDLDNTLYDWVGYFVASFYAMVSKANIVLDCDHEKLLDDFKKVHQKHHDAEYPFALLETETVLSKYPGKSKQELHELLLPVIMEFKQTREKSLHLHPTVLETLSKLRDRDIRLVAHTEANLFAVINRLEYLSLTNLFEKIYCRERSKVPHPNGAPNSKKYTEFPFEKVVELSHHQRKPDVDVLLEIIRSCNVDISKVAYVGDSMARDILMAKKAQVYSVYAEYGAQHDKELYDKLVRVTHWTPSEVAHELEIRKEAKNIQPDYILKNQFSEILDILR